MSDANGLEGGGDDCDNDSDTVNRSVFRRPRATTKVAKWTCFRGGLPIRFGFRTIGMTTHGQCNETIMSCLNFHVTVWQGSVINDFKTKIKVDKPKILWILSWITVLVDNEFTLKFDFTLTVYRLFVNKKKQTKNIKF